MIDVTTSRMLGKKFYSLGDCTSTGSGGDFLLRRFTMKMIGSAINAGIPKSTKRMIAIRRKSGPARLKKLARDGII